MSTLGELKIAVEGYLQISHTSVDAFQGSPQNETNFATLVEKLFYRAANNARKAAERRHDFACTLVSVPFVMPAGGSVSLKALVDSETTLPVNVRAVKQVFLSSDSALTPVRFTTRAALARRIRRTGTHQSGYGTTFVTHGDTGTLAVDAGSDTNMVMDAHVWMDEYPDGDETSSDFFTEHGFDYLMYATIVELNHLTSTFVQRQEGSLSPPERARDAAFESLVVNDVYSEEGFTNIDY